MIGKFQGGNESAREKLNELVEAVNSLLTVRGDEQFIAVNRGPGGTSIGLNINNVIARIPKPGLFVFPVKVIKDGGDAGGPTTACTFTYTVMDMLGDTMQKNADGDPAEGMTPEFNLRGSVGAMTAAPDNSHGLAFYVGTDLVLWMTEEEPAPAMALFPVLVWQDGGSTDGDKTTQCDRTYTVKTLDSATTLDTGATPKQARPPTGKLVCAPVSGYGVVGLGYVDDGGVFRLWSANETLDTTGCS